MADLKKYFPLFIGLFDYKFYFCLEFIKLQNMFTFAQYLGFLAFLTILTIGFWLMIFLIHFVFYWIGGALFEMYKEKKAQKALEQA